MTAGLPGIGIGGIFYLTCGLIMPLVEIFRNFNGRFSKQRWQMASVQFIFSCAILGSFWMTGILLGEILALFPDLAGNGQAGNTSHNMFKTQNVMISLAIMTLVLTSVHIANFLIDFKTHAKIFRQIKRWCYAWRFLICAKR